MACLIYKLTLYKKLVIQTYTIIIKPANAQKRRCANFMKRFSIETVKTLHPNVKNLKCDLSVFEQILRNFLMINKQVSVWKYSYVILIAETDNKWMIIWKQIIGERGCWKWELEEEEKIFCLSSNLIYLGIIIGNLKGQSIPTSSSIRICTLKYTKEILKNTKEKSGSRIFKLLSLKTIL